MTAQMTQQLTALSMRWTEQSFFILDQRALPHQQIWIEIKTLEHMIEALQKLAIRGAPAIGVGAALTLAQLARQGIKHDELKVASAKLRAARPTAVNLMNCLDRMNLVLEQSPNAQALFNEASHLYQEDIELCERMAQNGLPLIQPHDQILTICNTGGLATVGIGTAFGIFLRAHQANKNIHVYACETRPLLQGARLTAWECQQNSIPVTLLTDSMAGFLMAQKKISKVFVGADRIACNGDFANKIGTYTLAVLARHHHIPFYIVAPTTTLDLRCASGSQIEIEQRNPTEVRGQMAPQDVPVYNPAFDVTPAELVSGWILDQGLFSHDEFKIWIKKLKQKEASCSRS